MLVPVGLRRRCAFSWAHSISTHSPVATAEVQICEREPVQGRTKLRPKRRCVRACVPLDPVDLRMKWMERKFECIWRKSDTRDTRKPTYYSYGSHGSMHVVLYIVVIATHTSHGPFLAIGTCLHFLYRTLVSGETSHACCAALNQQCGMYLNTLSYCTKARKPTVHTQQTAVL
jgi:hypothetical protein